MEEDSVKNLETEVKEVNSTLDLDYGLHKRVALLRYHSPCGGHPIDLAMLNTSSREAQLLSNGNAPQEIRTSIEKFLLGKGYRVFGSSLGVSQE